MTNRDLIKFINFIKVIIEITKKYKIIKLTKTDEKSLISVHKRTHNKFSEIPNIININIGSSDCDNSIALLTLIIDNDTMVAIVK